MTLMRNGRDRRPGNPVTGHARKERVLLVGTRSADHIRASSHNGCTQRPDTWLHPNASLNRQIPLAPRAPSIHGPSGPTLDGSSQTITSFLAGAVAYCDRNAMSAAWGIASGPGSRSADGSTAAVDGGFLRTATISVQVRQHEVFCRSHFAHLIARTIIFAARGDRRPPSRTRLRQVKKLNARSRTACCFLLNPEPKTSR